MTNHICNVQCTRGNIDFLLFFQILFIDTSTDIIRSYFHVQKKLYSLEENAVDELARIWQSMCYSRFQTIDVFYSIFNTIPSNLL